MQAIFTLRREGFNQSIEVGETFTNNGEQYIVTNILKVSRTYAFTKTVAMEVEVLAQKVGAPSNFEKYKRISTNEIRYEKSEYNGKPRYKAGDVVVDDTNVAAMITGIKSVRYEFVDQIINYEYMLIRPWSEQEIVAAIKQNRISKFKVIG